MRFTYIDEGGNSGPVTGLNRDSGAGEMMGITIPQSLVHGVYYDFYEVVNGALMPKTQNEVDAIQITLDQHKQALRDRQEAIIARQESEGLKQITIEDAEEYISNQFDLTDLDASLLVFDAATTATEIKDALAPVFLEIRKLVNKTKAVHLKEIPYLLD